MINSQKRLKVACIGTGYFSQFHYDAWQRLDNVELVAVCDRHIEDAKATAERYGISAYFDDLEVMLSESHSDIVDIITPPVSHTQYVSTCLNAGLHVICQKPFGENLSQARSMSELADKVDKKLIVHDNFRFMPWYRKIKLLLDAKQIGDVLNITFKLRPGDGQGKDAYLARQAYFQTMPQLLIHETGVHYIDTFRYLIGEIQDVSARLRKCNPVIAGEDSGVVTFTFEGNVQGILDGNRCLDHATSNPRRTMGEMTIEGTQGSINLDGEANIWFRPFNQIRPQKIDYGWRDHGFGGDCVFQLTQHVVEHFCADGVLENTAKDYLRNIEIEQAIYQSHRERRVKDLP